MKKVLLFCVLTSCEALFAMPSSWVESRAKKTVKLFGNTDYFVSSARELDVPEKKLSIALNILRDPRYNIVYQAAAYGNLLHVYKKVDAEMSDAFGWSIFATKESPFELASLQVEDTEHGHGFGTLLFLYTIHVVRQLAYDRPECRLVWQALPLSAKGLKQAALNRFYEKLGGKIINEESNIFEWRGPSLCPFKLIEAQQDT